MKKTKIIILISKTTPFQSKCLRTRSSLALLQLPFNFAQQLRFSGSLGGSGAACDPKRSSMAILWILRCSLHAAAETEMDDRGSWMPENGNSCVDLPKCWWQLNTLHLLALRLKWLLMFINLPLLPLAFLMAQHQGNEKGTRKSWVKNTDVSSAMFSTPCPKQIWFQYRWGLKNVCGRGFI